MGNLETSLQTPQCLAWKRLLSDSPQQADCGLPRLLGCSVVLVPCKRCSLGPKTAGVGGGDLIL